MVEHRPDFRGNYRAAFLLYLRDFPAGKGPNESINEPTP